jgi:2-methylcitrate dehydratase PrpD
MKPPAQPTSDPVSRQLAEFLATVRFRDLPSAAVDDTRRSILDWLGSALGGSIEPPARMAQRVVASLGTSDEATVFGAKRASAAGAAMANGVASHILELDDVHKGSTLHAAAPVIPAALAVAEREHATGEAFILAVALGYEAALRVGEAVNPAHYRYWHPTGTAATFGAAAAAASLLRLNGAQTLDALGTAGTQAAGLWEFNADGAMSKHLHPGKAAMNGVLAADLAREGFTGATRILEGERGFFRATAAEFDASRITDGLGTIWKVSENCFKMHSCCGHTHTAVDRALDLRAANGSAIEDVLIETYGPGYAIVREPNPTTPYQAKFSIAYCVAAALTEGRVGLDQFSDDRFSPEGVKPGPIADLLARTRVVVSEDLTAMYPAAWPARLTVTFTDGYSAGEGAWFPRGNPENPVTTALLEDKFRGIVEPRLGAEVAARALAVLEQLPSARDVSKLFRQF